MEGLTEGRMVHYVMPSGEHRPAIVVKVWNKEAGVCNLSVFYDWNNDVKGENVTGIMWATSVIPDDDKNPGTWHWIEKA